MGTRGLWGVVWYGRGEMKALPHRNTYQEDFNTNLIANITSTIDKVPWSTNATTTTGSLISVI